MSLKYIYIRCLFFCIYNIVILENLNYSYSNFFLSYVYECVLVL